MEQNNNDQSLKDAVRDMQDTMLDQHQMMQQVLQTMQAMMARMEVQNCAQPIRREQQRREVGLPRYVDQPSLSTNRSFKKSGNGQGGSSRANTSSSSSGPSAAVAPAAPVAPRAVQNGALVQPSFRVSSGATATSAAKPVDAPIPRNSQGHPRAPISQSAAGTSDSSASVTLAKGDGSKTYTLQFGPISPGVMDGMQIPARTTSAPPNLNEQKQDQAHRGSFRAVPKVPIPSGPQQPQQLKKDTGRANQSNTGESLPPAWVKRDMHSQISAAPAVLLPKSSVLPMAGISMPMPFQQAHIPLQYGGPSPQLQSQGVSSSSLQIPMTLPVGNVPQLPQQMFIHGLQSHPLQPQPMMHQGQGLSFAPQMGHQMPSQLGSLGINVATQHFAPQQPGKFGAPRKTTVKITHPEIHEELRLDKRTDSYTDGGFTGQRSLPKERTIEALASLYGNSILSKALSKSDAKRLLVGLITMATNEAQDELVKSLLILCNKECNLWHALQSREGVQLLISLLGLSSEQQQECAVALLRLLSNENDESKWAITAGGIPPLVQILETGSPKAKEDSAIILGNLCDHSEDIRACVESADAVPPLLWLLKNGSDNGKEIASKTLNHLIHKSDSGTISQLSALLTSDQPESKVYILDALKSLLSVAPLNDILHEGSAANDAIETMIKILSSTREETQAKSASALAGLFQCRKDLRETHVAVKTLWSVMKLLNVGSKKILREASCCLADIFLSIEQNNEAPGKVSQKVEDRVSDLQEIHATVRAKLEETYAKYKAKADQQRRQQSFEVGDMVWVYLPRERYPQGAFTKLKPKKIGPCQVLEKFGDNAYRVELPDEVFISDVFNIRHLTPYAGENSSLTSSFSEEGENDEDINSDQSSGQSNQALDVPVPATQNQQTPSGKPTPGSLRRSKRLQNKRA